MAGQNIEPASRTDLVSRIDREAEDFAFMVRSGVVLALCLFGAPLLVAAGAGYVARAYFSPTCAAADLVAADSRPVSP